MHLAGAAKAVARLAGRDYVTPDDVREIAPNVLRHRIICEDGMTPEEALRLAFERVPAPTVADSY
jgi:MoxR-like ATPase